MENFPTYKKRVNFLFLETRNRYKLYLRLFQGLVASVVCFLVVYLNQRRDISITKPAQEIVYSLKSNLFRDGKFQSSLNYSKSGTDVIVYPLATPQHVKQADDHEDGLQLYIDKSSFRPSPKEQHLLTTTSKGPNHRAAGDHHHDPRFDTESLNSPTPDFESLVTLFAGFSRWADQNEIPYWIAHGNLLGWHWKSKSLSWDNCINVHVPANILFDMLSINGTIWSDRFMLVINDQFQQRDYEKGNAVDAMFVDTLTNLNIDIYGVSSLSKSLLNNPILHTKTPYSYEFQDIFPLVRTTLEGIPTWRPFNTTKILEKEFGYDGTHSMVYLNSRFDPILNDWIKIETCKQLYQSYIEPIVNGQAPVAEFPRYHWVQSLREKSGLGNKCAVIEFKDYHVSRKITGYWAKRDRGFKGIVDQVVDGARRRIPAAQTGGK